MRSNFPAAPSRRGFLASGAAAIAAAAWPHPAAAAAGPVADYRLKLTPATLPLVGGKWPATKLWTYGGRVPGPELRVAQGGRLRVEVANGLGVPTTVHWHGLRVPNAMDGVPELTQKPIAPGATFTYEFDCPDAGTYWYHPHMPDAAQLGRGLYGALIVEEAAPPRVDRDVTWVLDDWRLGRDAQITDDFGHMRDISHGGRLGNTVTVNGRMAESFAVMAGERIRLRLVNAANARIFALEFRGHRPTVIALDGQPVAPHEAEGGRIVLGPAMRADVILDMTGAPGEKFAVADTYYRRGAFRLLDLVYGETRLRERPPQAAVTLAANPLPEPDLKSAKRHRIGFGGGMMGRMSSAMLHGRRVGMRELFQSGKAWTVNGVAATGHVMDPLLTLQRGKSYVLAMDNDTAWDHPIHLHGHSFRVIARNGRPTARREWQDTVLMAPGEKVDIALVADNPGDWLFHCHIIEHMIGGMSAVLRRL